jgi:hypothetical protein
MPKHQTSTRSRREFLSGAERIQKYVGKRKVSFYYQHVDKTTETLATAPLGDRQAIAEAERVARRKALDIQQGQIIAGSVASLIERFEDEVAPTHYRDQSKEGKSVRASTYKNLKAFFGQMAPMSLKTVHGYQYLDARAKAGAPAKANKELSLMSTICHYAVRWGVIEANPFTDMMQNKTEKDTRTITRSQVVRFYLWCQHQENRTARLMGCLALFTYLTGFRTAEVRPLLKAACTPKGVMAIGAKRKRGEAEVVKLREWSPRLRMVVKRIEQAQVFMPAAPTEVTELMARIAILIAKGESAKRATATVGMKEPTYYYWKKRIQKDERVRPSQSDYLFPAVGGKCYTKGGLTSSWQEVMLAYVSALDETANESTLTQHAEYFAPLDIRPAAITTKLDKGSADAYDFAAHANPSTTHRHYDRRKVRKAGATE